ncbi:MAG: acyl carrier protein [Pseudomonadota bacterium]
MKQTQLNGQSASLVSSGSDDLIFQKVCALLAPFNQNDIPLTRDTAIVSDLEVDSVAVFDLIMEVEDAYDITFPMETVSDIKTVGDLVDTIRTLKASGGLDS